MKGELKAKISIQTSVTSVCHSFTVKPDQARFHYNETTQTGALGMISSNHVDF